MSKITFYSGERKKYRRGIDYNNERDYSEEIDRAVKAGDENLAARLEDERNRKIDGENLPYRKTYNYIDIGTKIQKGIREGASPNEIKELTDARRDKAFQSDRYDAYKSDEIQKEGKRYYYNAASGAGANYENRPDYKNTYESDIRSLLSKISNRKEFSYDPESDPVYQGLRQQMSNEAKKAITDVSAEFSQMGGGANSYAASAAASAANSYRSKLTEKLPELYQMAYKRYSDNLDNQRKALDYTMKASDTEYNKYLDSLSQFNKDRDYADKNYENDITREESEDKRKYDAGQDKLDNEYREKVFDEKVKQDEFNNSRKLIDAARELILYYEGKGISVPKELLETAEMEGYADANKESASVSKRIADLNEIVKRRQIANYDARTSKIYNDTRNSNIKTELAVAKANEKKDDKKSKSSSGSSSSGSAAEELLGAEGMSDADIGIKNLKESRIKNKRNASGIYIGSEFFTYNEMYSAICRRLVSVTRDSSGQYSLSE